MAKVFISYSRKDIEFAKRLTDELKKSDLDFWIDWEGIPPTVDWWREIEKGIEEADVFVFLISPHSSASKVCGQEIDCAIKNSKRIIPLVVREVKGEEAPPQLSHLNWIFIRESDDFSAALQKLLTAMHTDYEWVQSHRRLQVKALEWERNHKDHGFLLRGKDLIDAETNLATNTSREPHPTDLQREYVFESRKSTDRQRRVTTAISIVGVIALAALAVFGFVQAGLAREAQVKAEAQTRRATAGQLALESKSALDQYPQRAMLLALEAVRINQDANEPVLPQAEEALRLANQRISGIGINGFEHEASLIQFTEDGKWLIAGTIYEKGEAHIWNVAKMTGDPTYQPFSIAFPGSKIEAVEDPLAAHNEFYISQNQSWLIISTHEGGSALWKIDVQDESRVPVTFDGSIQQLVINGQTRVLERQPDQIVVWDVNEDTLAKTELQRLPGQFVFRSDNERYVLLENAAVGLQLWDLSTQPAKVLGTLTRPNISAKSAFFDPSYEWLVVIQEVEHPDIQIEVGYPSPDDDTWITVIEPWKSHNLIVFSMKDLQRAPVVLELGVALHLWDSANGMYEISPDEKGFLYIGDMAPRGGEFNPNVIGYLQLSGNAVQHTFVECHSTWGLLFIGNHFVSCEVSQPDGTASFAFMDLRDGSIVPDPEQKYVPSGNTPSSDGKYIPSGQSMLNLQQLEDSHELVFEPLQPELFPMETPANETAVSDFARRLAEEPLSLGLEDVVIQSAISPDGKWLAAGTADGSMRVWNKNDPFGDTQIALPSDSEPDGYIALSNDNQWLANGRLLLQLSNGNLVKSYELVSEDESAYLAVFSPDSHWLMVITAKTTVESVIEASIIDLRQLRSEGTVSRHPVSDLVIDSTSVQFSKDSQWVVLQNWNSILYQPGTQESYTLPYKPFQAVFTDEGEHMLTVRCRFDGDIQYCDHTDVWSLPKAGSSLQVVGEIKSDPGTRTMIPSQDGRWLATLSDTTEIKLMDGICVVEEGICEPLTLSGNKVAFSRDSKTLLVGLEEKGKLQYEIWDLQSSPPKKVSTGNTDQTNVVLGSTAQWAMYSKQAEMAGSFLSSSWFTEYMSRHTTYDGFGFIPFGGGGGGGPGIGSYQIDYFVEARQTPQDQSIRLRGHESNVSLSQVSPNERYVLTYSGGLQDDLSESENVLRLWDMTVMQAEPKTRGMILPFGSNTRNSSSDGASQLVFAVFSPDSQWIYMVESRFEANSEGNATTQVMIHVYPTSIQALQERACKVVGRNLIINEWERFFPYDEYRRTCDNLPAHPSVNVENTPDP